MKNFYDLTKAELAALKTEDVERYINLACAEEGIPLVPELPEKPVQPILAPDVVLYEIAGMVVKTMSEAEQIQKLFNGIPTYQREYAKCIGDTYVYSPEERSYNDPTKIRNIKAISNDLYMANKKNIETYKTEKGEYDRIESKFKDIKTKRERLESEYWSVCRDAIEWLQNKEELKNTFAQYLELADGDTGIAWKFLLKANEDLETIYPDLQSELMF